MFMFNDNKYTKLYYKIILCGKERKPDDGYYECHHIIPLSLGGCRGKDNETYLTSRQHFLCHLLLVKMVRSNKHRRSMAFAFFGMSRSHGGNRKINSRLFELYKTKYRYLTCGENSPVYGMGYINAGEKNPMYGKPCYYNMTEDQKQKWKNNISSAMCGENNHFYGKTHTNETKMKLSAYRSIPIKVIFVDGRVEHFDKIADLGKYLGKSKPLAQKLCDNKYAYLLPNYGILQITRETLNYEDI